MKARTRSRRILPSIATFVVLFPIANSCAHQQPLTVVRLAVGSENVPFFQNDQVRGIFHTYGYDVQVTGFGSRQLVNVDLGRYDGFVPSSSVTAEQFQNAHPSLKSQYDLFQSPLAIATYRPVVSCLRRLGLAYQDTSGVWWFKVAAYLAAFQDGQHAGDAAGDHSGMEWSDCGASLASLPVTILLTTTNPECSNSGEMFMADASYVANGEAVPLSSAVAGIASKLRPMIADQGFMAYTTDVVFSNYLTQGMGSSPMALIYESEFIGEEITNHGAMRPDMVLMYPIPDIYSQRTLIPRDFLGAAIGQLLRTSPRLLLLAQQSYGFRYSNPERFQQIVGHFRFFGRKIVVPLLFEQARAPVPSILEDIINATVTPSPPHSTASTC